MQPIHPGSDLELVDESTTLLRQGIIAEKRP